jgi:hypothetical protein
MSCQIKLDRVTNLSFFKHSDRLTCRYLCNTILIDPVKCILCDSHFCRKCYTDWILICPNCPSCKNKLEVGKPEKYLQQDLSDLLIKCNICTAEQLYDNISKHESSCEFKNIGDDINAYSCQHCEKNILTKDNHDIQKCLETVVQFKQIEINKLKTILNEKRQLYFSKHLKQRSISLENPLIAEQTEGIETYSGVVLMKPKLGMKIWKWQVEITNYEEWIGIGICDIEVAYNLNYTLTDANIENRGHGGYFISCNSFIWSYTDGDINFQNCFYINQGEVIEIEYNPFKKTLSFLKVGTDDTVTLNISHNDAYYAAVILGGYGDTATIKHSEIIDL